MKMWTWCSDSVAVCAYCNLPSLTSQEGWQPREEDEHIVFAPYAMSLMPSSSERLLYWSRCDSPTQE